MAIVADTPIPTPKGYTLASDLKPGDYIFDPQGNPQPVLSVQGYISQDCYRATFSDGLSIEGDRHMSFMLQSFNYRIKQANWFKNQGSKYAKRFRRKMEKLSAAQLHKSKIIRDHNNNSEYALTNIQPLRYPQVDLPVPPYVFGLWIGSITPAGRHWLRDKDFNNMQRKVRQHGFNLVKKKSSSGGRWEFFFRPSVRESFTHAGVLIPTMIPQPYLEADVDSRWALLDGLIDAQDVTESKQYPGLFMARDAWLPIRRKQQLVEGLGMGSRLLKSDLDTKFELNFRFPNKNLAANRRFLRKIEKISAKKCVHIETKAEFVAGEGFLAVC